MKEFLKKNQAVIVAKWKEAIVDTYQAETAEFLKKKKDQFSNPLGHTITQSVEGLYEGLINKVDAKTFEELVDPFVRIRAIQDFPPSQAVGFMFLLKNIIRQEAGTEFKESDIVGELLDLDSRIDDLTLIAFDVYMKCRNKIHEIKMNEILKKSRGLLGNPKMRAFLDKRGELKD